MEKIVEQTLLYDFYGELLTEHQKQMYEAIVFNDLSLSEVAQEWGISRQGVHDLIRRCTNTLKKYEQRLHLIEKFQQTKEKAQMIHRMTKEFRSSRDDALLDQIEIVAGELTYL